MSEQDKAHTSDSPVSKRQWQDYGLIKEKVVDLLKKNPQGLTGASIAEMVGITPGAMSKYLSMLNVDGIITSRKVGVAKLWKLVSSADRSDFLANKMGSDSVNFKDYALSLVESESKLLDPDNNRVLAMPTTILTNLYEYTKSIVGSEVHAFFYQWGKRFTVSIKDLVKNMADKTHGNFIQSFLLLLRIKGWGRFDISLIDDKTIEVIWHDSIWSEVKPDGNSPVDDFMAGALTEAASITFGGNWWFTEIECKALGGQFCKFKGLIST